MKKTLLAVLAILTLLTGCSKSENTNTVSTDGSTSMEKVIGILGEVFTENNKGVNFTYNPTGSGTGISSVLENRCDIGLSSRNLKQSEIEKGLKVPIDLKIPNLPKFPNNLKASEGFLPFGALSFWPFGPQRQ